MNNNVNITKKEFDELEVFDPETVYFLTDSKDLYLGDQFIKNISDEVTDAAKSIANLAIEKAVERMKEDVDSEYKNKYLYLMAEFENAKKWAQKDKEDTIKTANEKIIKSLIGLIDDFERSIKYIDGENREGVLLIYDKFVRLLESNNVECINPSEGELFDESCHEAVIARPAEREEDKGIILECVEKGYTLNNKVIRYAKVIVLN